MTKSFDHLLRETLNARPPEPSDGCLDPDVLAAWFEGTLSPDERAVAEAHAAECSRCQAALAAMIRSESPLGSRPWWRSPAFGWLVPITVAAAALVIFIRPYWSRLDSGVAVQHAPAVVAAPAEQAPVAPPSVPRVAGTAEVDSLAPKVTPAPQLTERRARQSARQEPMVRLPQQASAGAPAASPGFSAVEAGASKDRIARLDESTLQRAASAAASPPPPPPVASEPAPAPVAVATPPVAATAPRRPAEEKSIRTADLAEKAVAETLVLNTRAAVAAGQRPIVIQSPRGSTRWRISMPGWVERSNDAGASWETQTTGVNAVITNGAAPSDSVCWLVGKAGIVLQSTDGRSWRRLPFPQAVDLISVAPTDANTATVGDASGRTFTTTDGGKSWK